MQILVIGIIVFIKKNPLCGMVTADRVMWWFSLRWHLELFWADEQKCHLSAWWSVRLLNGNAINCHFFKTKRKPFNYFNNFASYWAEIRVYTLLNRRSLDTSYRPFPAWLCLFRRGESFGSHDAPMLVAASSDPTRGAHRREQGDQREGWPLYLTEEYREREAWN